MSRDVEIHFKRRRTLLNVDGKKYVDVAPNSVRKVPIELAREILRKDRRASLADRKDEKKLRG